MWNKLDPIDKSKINREIILEHHAVQFIARAGKYLLPEQTDDSHTNMEWITAVNSFVGNPLPFFMRVGVRLPDLSLVVLDENLYVQQSIEMAGLTGDEIFEWLCKVLQSHRINAESLMYDLHYAIPDHTKYDKHPLPEPEREAAEVTGKLRANANTLLNVWARKEPNAAAVRVWPHHFDTGTFIPFAIENGSVTQSIGLGLAIADDLSDEPYFYVNHWQHAERKVYPQLPEPGEGHWIIGGWKGSVLPYSRVVAYKTAEKQQQVVQSFFEISVNKTKALLEGRM